MYFQTTVQGIKHYVIFSDMKEEFKGRRIHNVLSRVSAQMKKPALNLKFYRDLHGNQHPVTKFMR